MYPGRGYWKTSYVALGTRRVKRGLTICFCVFALMLAGSSLKRGRADAGDTTRAMNAGKWSATIVMMAYGQVYTIEKSGALYVTNPTSGKRVQLGKPDFADTEFMFTNWGGTLYTIEADGSMYRVNNDGTWIGVGQAGDWKDTIALVSVFSTIYTIERNGALYKTELDTGRWVQVGKADFANTRFMFRYGNPGVEFYLYTIEDDGSVYRINPENGTWIRVGKPGDWKDTILAAQGHRTFYTVERNGALYKTDMATATWKQIGKAEFGNVRFMCGSYNGLYIIEDGDLYSIDQITGRRTAIGK